MHQEIPDKLDALARLVVDAAFKVHKALGPGLLESAYQACLEIELERRCVRFISQNVLPICYEGTTIEGAYRVDLLVDDQLIVELKAVDQLLPIHSAQLLTYLRLSGNRLGLLINFNTPLIKDGIKRIVL
ncbi:MAG: GxxExxY protein [Propionivibrio sp.]|nr:GxxExxY protein [Propionivibrio sp.]MBK7565495.1 GxxExxY protein [Propionivibrio sp.]MBK9028900.1 GxxExxY protein [Propionivibrio sp.]